MARKTTSKTSSSKRKTADKDEASEATAAPEVTEESSDTETEAGTDTSEGSAALSASVDGAEAPKDDEPADTPATPEPKPLGGAKIATPDPATPGDPQAETQSDDSGPWGEDTAAMAPAGDTGAAPTGTKPESHTKPAPAEQVVVRKGGFLPMLLGGVAAGAIGFGAAYYLFGQPADTSAFDTYRSETDESLQAQSDRLDALAGQLENGPDLSALEQGQAELQDTLSTLSDQLTETRETVAALSARLDEVESRPLTEGASEAAAAAYEAELKKLQDAMAAQRAEIEQMVSRAEDLETEAETTAQATLRRAALSRILTALDAGGGYADALADLQETGMEVPEPLTRAADSGVATLPELQEGFPDAARAALAAARNASAEAGESGGLSAFIRTQLGARSLEPREGDDPDAILSRAEAATNAGRLTDALAEIEALPEVARAELSDWAGQAARRLEAVAAAQQLSEELN
ncbi:hypothetical protein [Roseovarius sp.]|uniref:COG4223 family protein n=1 Tax=Roseovarius sp. TaxID=1486281 RepID=UPI002628B455|nr:hypothetical protein [Roseovarius sp.]MDM8164982.1 hypothetical protein [Roseovarius sp.]